MCVLFATITTAAELQWETSKAAAFAKALQENKLVLMLRGNPGCQYCQDAKNNTCETTDPNIVGLIQQYYVPWFDEAWTSDEGEIYVDRIPLPGGGFSLYQAYPIFACIDPHLSNECYDVSMGDLQYGKELTTTSFYARLTSHIIPKTKEKAKLKIFWGKDKKDKYSVKLQFMSEEKPFDTDSEVEVKLGKRENEVIAMKKAAVKGNHLSVAGNNAKLKLVWNKKKKICTLIFKIKKATLDETFDYIDGEFPPSGFRAAQIRFKVDKTVYYFYPKLKYHVTRKMTTGYFIRKN